MKKCIVMILALVMALCLAACGSKPAETPQTTAAPTEAPQTTAAPTEAADMAVTVLGEGATVFSFSVVDLEGNETKFEIHTDETTVGGALMALDLIAGEMGDYGMYVKTVNGITADWDADQTYWAFYINGEYGMTGVDVTDIDPGCAYSFVHTQG